MMYFMPLSEERCNNNSCCFGNYFKKRSKLFEARKKRTAPATDTKILTAWNRLMISALAKGYQVLGNKNYLKVAQKAVDFLIENIYIEDKILRVYRPNKHHLNGFLSDYAFLIAAFIIEGSATKLVKELADETKPFANLYKKVKETGLIDCVCKACAAKMGALDAAVEQNLTRCDELNGHPSLAKYLEQGYQIITF